MRDVKEKNRFKLEKMTKMACASFVNVLATENIKLLHKNKIYGDWNCIKLQLFNTSIWSFLDSFYYFSLFFFSGI